MPFTPTGQPTEFSAADVCELTGARLPQLEHWVRQCGLVPMRESTGRGSHRVYSLTNVIETAIARELSTAGMTCEAIRQVLGQLREQVNKLRPELRASATLVRFVEMVDAIARIKGPGPNYVAWRRDVDALLQSWTRNPETPLDDRILAILAGRQAAERASGQHGTVQ